MTGDESIDSGPIDPTAAGEGVENVPILERDETGTTGAITMRTTDVTAWCPYEGTADYYDIEIAYLPEEYVVELMSLRDYFGSYRDEVISHEDFAQQVFDHLCTLLEPAWLRLTVDAPPRYGIETEIVHDTREHAHDPRDGDGDGVPDSAVGDEPGNDVARRR